MEVDKLSNEELLEIYQDNHAFIEYLNGLLNQALKEMNDDE